jgi:hypothetical protein
MCLVFAVCCVSSGLCDELITLSEEPYVRRVCSCLIVGDLETSIMRLPRPDLGCCAIKEIYELNVFAHICKNYLKNKIY